MRIGIVGGGAIGLLASSYLSRNHSVSVYVRRQDQKEAINTYGLYRDGMQYLKNIQAKLIGELRREEAYIICVKQTHLKQVLPNLENIVDNAPVLFLQNGMGHLEYAKEALYPTYVGTVEHGALRRNDHSIQHTGKGHIKVASYTGDTNMLSYLVNQMNENTFPVYMVEKWDQLLKGKLIINAIINPLTALFHVRNGCILTVPHIKILARSLCREAASVLDLDDNEAWESVRMVVLNTRENMSSMLEDIQKQRETENDAITGYILRNSKQDIPNTAFIYHAIKAKESLFCSTEKNSGIPNQ